MVRGTRVLNQADINFRLGRQFVYEMIVAMELLKRERERERERREKREERGEKRAESRETREGRREKRDAR